jgi:hypothetical protein
MTLRDDDFEPGLRPDERSTLLRTAARLATERPIPRPAFRGALERNLAAGRQPALAGWLSRARTKDFAFGSLATGTALLILAALGIAEIGPLAPNDVADALASALSAL